MILWSVSRVLAHAPRPGYPERSISRIEVEDWVREARSLGITTVICLMSDAELGLYASALAVVGGLLGFYRSRGLEVHHVPVEPGRQPAVSDEQLEQIVESFKQAHKPVLVHASADEERTADVIAKLRQFLGC